MQTIVIEVSGGVVQEVYTNATDLQIVLVDWDKGESPGDDYSSCRFPSQTLCTMPKETQLAASNHIQ